MMETETINFIDANALKIMANMGYKNGTGLGKQSEGIKEPLEVSGNLGKRGLGFELPNVEQSEETWDFTQEVINVKEEVQWTTNWSDCSRFPGSLDGLLQWIVRGPPKLNIDNENKFCDSTILQEILKAKDIFNELDVTELSKARCRANPFESIRSAFFMNRAALKIANIDVVTDFIFTNIDRNPKHSKTIGPYYFADVCAGPGGFTEYVLWRKKWAFKGFGFTLKAEHDFEIEQSQCASSATFSAHYGARGDGDVCNPENIDHFAKQVMHGSDGLGVHFMMSDGGFSVEGNENLQEILSKQIYLCQCLMALKIVRPHGHFVTKLFDLFTEFSVGLVFLMYKCFEKIAIFKPNTSRPANAERYLICYGLKKSNQISMVTEYLSRIAEELWDLRQVQKTTTIDINEIVPLPVITADQLFSRYIFDSNNSIGVRQILGLHKLEVFCRNPSLVEPRQDDLRKQCLQYWQIPIKAKVDFQRCATEELLNAYLCEPGFLFLPPKIPVDLTHLSRMLKDTNEWYYTTLNGTKESMSCSFFAGVSGCRVYRLDGRKWKIANKLRLQCGTLLYGEIVKEYQIQDGVKRLKLSLHVIDALRLGDISLNDMSFKERYDLIDTYCQAANHESQINYMRIRPKYFTALDDTTMLQMFSNIGENELRYCSLNPLGINSISEFYEINSVLLMRISSDYCFVATYLKRIFIHFKKGDTSKNDETFFNKKITPNSLIELFKAES